MLNNYIFNKLFLSLVASVLLVSCKSQVENYGGLNKIKVDFIINDSSCIIDSSFEIIFKNLNDSILCSNKAVEDSVLIPDSLWDAANYFKVSIKYNSFLLPFDSVSSILAKPSKGMDWKFGVEKKPFLVVGSIIHPDMTKNDTNLMEIYYWKFRPYNGHGRQIIKKVYYNSQ